MGEGMVFLSKTRLFFLSISLIAVTKCDYFKCYQCDGVNLEECNNVHDKRSIKRVICTDNYCQTAIRTMVGNPLISIERGCRLKCLKSPKQKQKTLRCHTQLCNKDEYTIEDIKDILYDVDDGDCVIKDAESGRQKIFKEKEKAFLLQGKTSTSKFSFPISEKPFNAQEYIDSTTEDLYKRIDLKGTLPPWLGGGPLPYELGGTIKTMTTEGALPVEGYLNEKLKFYKKKQKYKNSSITLQLSSSNGSYELHHYIQNLSVYFFSYLISFLCFNYAFV